MISDIRKIVYSHISTLFALAIAVTGCATETEAEQAAPVPSLGVVGQSTLELTSKSDSEVAGVYSEGATSLRFEARRLATGSVWALYQGNGKEMFRVEHVANTVVTTVMGSYRQRLDATVLAKLKADQMDEAALAAGAVSDGDPSMLGSLEALPEFAQMPGLSKALGERGVTGRTYPVTLPLHMLAERVQELRGKVAPALLDPSSEKALSLAPGGPCFIASGQFCCAGKPCTPISAAPPPVTCESVHPYPDLQCDPNHDDCFGMCGPGCTCWDSICGDCQYHATCAQHDWFCGKVSSASWYEWTYNPLLPFYAAQCYGGVSVLIAAVGCDPGRLASAL